jgi:hypothetical protein
VAKDPRLLEVRVAARPIEVDGAVLVWGATSPEGSVASREMFGFSAILSIEEMLSDLREWRSPSWELRVQELRAWTSHLLDGLAGTSG